MKDVFKGVATKILTIILTIVVIAGILAGGGYWAYRKFRADKTPVVTHEESIDIVEILEEKLEISAELNTAEYICTYIEEFSDTKEVNGWNIPFTKKNFTISYEGTVKAGIKDLTQAEIREADGAVTITLPQAEITAHEIDKDTLEVYDESQNILNQISVEDVNSAQENLEEEMVARATEYGLLDTAKTNAETIIGAMLKGVSDDYTIVIEWQE